MKPTEDNRIDIGELRKLLNETVRLWDLEVRKQLYGQEEEDTASDRANAIDADKLDEITKCYADVNRKSRNYGFDKQFNTLCEGRCEGIAMTLSKLGYRIVKDERGGYFAVQKGGTK